MRKPSVEEKRIKNLEEELSETRELVLDLMAGKAREILTSYHRYEPSDDHERLRCHAEWKRNVVSDIMEIAKPVPSSSKSCFSDRVFCPLCGADSSAPHATGFTIEGLRRHLTGESRAHECGVMKAARKLAMEYWKFCIERKQSKR